MKGRLAHNKNHIAVVQVAPRVAYDGLLAVRLNSKQLTSYKFVGTDVIFVSFICINKIFLLFLYPNEYNLKMYFIEKTKEFDKWFRRLNDIRAKAKILFRLQKLETQGHFGDCKPVGSGISELKINYAKGYRIYFKETDGKIIILLIGGDKSTQQKDIEKAKEIWNKLKK